MLLLTPSIKDGRRKLFDGHKNEFEAHGIAWRMFSQPKSEADAGEIDEDPEAITETRRVVFGGRRVRFEARDLGGEATVGGGRIVFPNGETMVEEVVIGERELTVGLVGKMTTSG